jgi:hypothetical protein
MIFPLDAQTGYLALSRWGAAEAGDSFFAPGRFRAGVTDRSIEPKPSSLATDSRLSSSPAGFRSRAT